jgi:prepilin-type N-terminal cleavage/methylation domain-containing protein
MNSSFFLKIIQNLYPNQNSFNNKKLYKHQHLTHTNSPDTGFTLLEVIVVVVIIGILSAISAPTWLAFTNRQKVNKVNDVVLSVLQDAQRQAKKNKRSYSVWFREETATKDLQYAVVPTKKADEAGTNITSAEINIWKSLGGEVGVNSKQFLMLTNITANNCAITPIANCSTSTASTASTTKPLITAATKYITFDYMGILPDVKFGTPANGSTEPPGLKLVVAVPKTPNSTDAGDTKRCVIVQTILGGMRTAKDKDCDK